MADKDTPQNPKHSVTRREFLKSRSQRKRYAMIRVLLLCTALFASVASPDLPNARAAAHYPQGDWSWVTDTFWYVTQENLPAVETNLTTQQHLLVSDQTVWHIEAYSQGYFWGKTVVQITGGDPLCLSMVGSITPEGEVQMTFTLPLPGFPPELSLKTSGIGRMRLLQGEWKFEMQMTTGVTKLTTHWAYMTQCKPGDQCVQQLPGVQSSLQDFLEQCSQ
jgi:hypothetical protein